MALHIDTVARACQKITEEIKILHKNLTVYYIVHHEGQRRDALSLAAQDIMDHPASDTALHILKRRRKSQESSILGTAVAQKNIFFGLATEEEILTLCTINLEQFSEEREAYRHAFHLAWHAIDSVQYHANPANRSGKSREVILRRRNPVEMAADNLKADVFAAIAIKLHGEMNVTDKIAAKRCKDALTPHSYHYPEYFPFALAREITNYAYDELKNKNMVQKKIITTAMKIADEVGRAFDTNSLQHWIEFSEPAQDLVWRGYEADHVLSAAINTSKDPAVRTMGHLVAEITGITPADYSKVIGNYSPFADDEYNHGLHEKMVFDVFEDVIAQGLRQRSAAPFLEKANLQNKKLAEGHILGWCAAALQQAGSAYEQDLARGGTGEDIARQTFIDVKEKAGWGALTALGQKVVKHHRQGDLVTVSTLHEICDDIEGIDAIKSSVKRTMDDPSYTKTMEANIVPGQGMKGPRGPAPKAQPQTPAPTVAAAPKIGGKSTTIPQKKQVTQEQPETDEKEN